MQIVMMARVRLLRPTLLMVCVSVVLAAAVLGIVGWALYDARQQARHLAEQATGNLALSLERDIGRTVESLDLSLRAAVQGMRVPGLAAMTSGVRQAVLFDGSTAAKGFGDVFVTDENGQVVYSSREPEARTLNLAHRSYFQAHRERADLGLVVSEPIRALSDGAWTIALARRLDHPDGTFAGVVMGGLRLGHFDRLFHALALGERGTVTLFSTDKRVVARRPYAEQDIGRDVSGAETFRQLAQAPFGTFEARAVVDGVQRLHSYRQVGSLPLVLNVAFATEDIYAEWTEKSAILGGVLLLLALLGAGLAWTLRRELRRRGHAEWRARRAARHLARARDEAERASRAKSGFLAGMSHELRTPLNGILGYAHLLRLEGGLNAVQSARVDAMLGAGTHLLEMINRVLDLSEVEAERMELRASTVDPDQVARACLDLVRPGAEAKGLMLSLDAAPGTPWRLSTDPTRLRQVLLNLLGNAVKFTAHGAIELRLRPAANGAALRIEVADTGPGIPAGQRHRLFQDFERLGADATAVEGAGLGLALSARFVALLGGRIGHEDNPGGGSVFWLELPLVASAVATATEPTVGASRPAGVPDARPAPTPAHPLRVLVVDDTAMNRDVAGSFLRAAGHTVVCVEGGAEAVTAAEAGDFDVILMDARMPEMDGLEATRRVRALSGPRGRVPIVALTAQAFAEQVAECRAAGMDDHLAKPFAPDALLAVVMRAVAVGHERSTPGTAAETAPAPGTEALGSEGTVLDAAVFQRTAALLAPETVASYLRTIAGRSETLLRGLRAPDAPLGAAGDLGLAGLGPDLAAAAHTLVGSAGMFGFERLASAARRFEFATETGASDAQALAAALAAAIEASLPEMLSRARVAAAASTARSGSVTGDLATATGV